MHKAFVDPYEEHKKICPLAGGRIVNWNQRELKRARKG